MAWDDLRERGRRGNEVVATMALERGARLSQLLAQGEPLKRAAWQAGMAVRTARRHRREWQHA